MQYSLVENDSESCFNVSTDYVTNVLKGSVEEALSKQLTRLKFGSFPPWLVASAVSPIAENLFCHDSISFDRLTSSARPMDL